MSEYYSDEDKKLRDQLNYKLKIATCIRHFENLFMVNHTPNFEADCHQREEFSYYIYCMRNQCNLTPKTELETFYKDYAKLDDWLARLIWVLYYEEARDIDESDCVKAIMKAHPFKKEPKKEKKKKQKKQSPQRTTETIENIQSACDSEEGQEKLCRILGSRGMSYFGLKMWVAGYADTALIEAFGKIDTVAAAVACLHKNQMLDAFSDSVLQIGINLKALWQTTELNLNTEYIPDGPLPAEGPNRVFLDNAIQSVPMPIIRSSLKYMQQSDIYSYIYGSVSEDMRGEKLVERLSRVGLLSTWINLVSKSPSPGNFCYFNDQRSQLLAITAEQD